jgi:two-component system sensor histidine kinase KdpD
MNKQSPSETLPSVRGRHKIIIGAAPGVGKTYRMLHEAQLMKADGVDVVVGFLNSYGRPETLALQDGLEVIARLPDSGEMDLAAILARRPQTVLVDELSHLNAAGGRHGKRHEDVSELLTAGINVISTLNVQHIESLTDIVERITGVEIAERIPDAIIDEADEVVLVDISIDELRERFQRGKVYPEGVSVPFPEKLFEKANLVALRELALRELADTIEEQVEQDSDTSSGLHERILVCISTHPKSQRLIRRGYRMAERLNAELIVLFVKLKGREVPEEYLANVEKHRSLTEDFGGKFLEVEATSLVDAVVDVARQWRITQIFIGESLRQPGLLSFLRPAISYQIFERLSNVDMHIISLERDFIKL